MDPVKNLLPIARWMLRVAALVIIFSTYFGIVETLAFDTLSYFLALAFIVFSVLLFVGGFMKNSDMTVISGLLIFILSLVVMFMGGFTLQKVLSNFPTTALGFYFLARGNWG